MEGVEKLSYDPLPNAENPNLAGQWIAFDDDSAEIRLFDHQEAIGSTLHHEVAHHLIDTHPDLLEQVTPHISGSPLLDQLHVDLHEYNLADQPEEFAADAFSYFKTKPELLHEIDPALYKTIATWWQNHA